MKGKERAELKNRILRFLIDDPGHSYPTETLWKELDKPVKSLLVLNDILEEMVNTGSKYFSVHGNPPHVSYTFNDLTQDFLSEGGFVNQYESELEAHEEMLKLETQGQRIQDLTEENLKLTNKLNQQKIKTHWWPIGISALGLLVAILSMVKASMTDQHQGNTMRLDMVESKINQIRTDYQKKNDSLYEELVRLKIILHPSDNEMLNNSTTIRDSIK